MNTHTFFKRKLRKNKLIETSSITRCLLLPTMRRKIIKEPISLRSRLAHREDLMIHRGKILKFEEKKKIFEIIC